MHLGLHSVHRSICAALVWTCVLVGLPSTGRATLYDWTDGYYRLRLNIPDSVETVRGIVIWGNGGGGNNVNYATNAELVALAESIDFAVLGTGYWFNFSDPGGLEIAYFEEQIAAFATNSGHAELTNAPYLPMGHSNGGQMSYGFAILRPEKVIAFATSKGTYYVTNRPSEAALRIPGLLIAGVDDEVASRVANRGLFETNRPRGALWAWVEEPYTGHSDNYAANLKMAFFAECYRLRYPSDQSPTNGPVRLNDLNEFDGWLVGVGTNNWYQPLPPIYRYDDAPGDKRAYGWVPNERIARIYQTLAARDKYSATVTGSIGVTNGPTNLFYSTDLKDAKWTKVEFYQGAEKIGEVASNGFDRVEITPLAESGGLYVFHAVVTSNNIQSPTYLRRVFVNAPARLTPFQQWAETNLPSGTRGPKDVLHAEDGIANLTRFVFNLGTNANPSRDALPQFAGFTNTGGVQRALFQYRVGTAQRESGVNVRPGMSTNMLNWSPVRSPVFASDRAAFWREGDTNKVLLPASSKGFLRMLLDDCF